MLGRTIRCYWIPPGLEVHVSQDKPAPCALSHTKQLQFLPPPSANTVISPLHNIPASHPESLLPSGPQSTLHNWRSGPQSTLCTPGVVLLKPKSGQNPSLIKTLQSPCNDYKVLHSLASLSPLTFFTTHSPFTLSSPASWPLADHESSFASVSWIPAELALWWLS